MAENTTAGAAPAFPKLLPLPKIERPLTLAVDKLADVRSAADLPSRLVFGDLQADSFKFEKKGWSAEWRDADGHKATAVDEVLRRTHGQLDALFNNGGFGQVGAVEDLSRASLREQFETNLFGWLELTNLIVPVMRRQGRGRIVMNSSVLGYAAMAYRGAYNAVKFAVEGISDTLRHELHGTGIHVCLVEPGPIISRFRENCLLHFQRHIAWQSSVHRVQYEGQMARLNQPGPAAPFTLPPEAVLAKVVHAVESRRPRPRYPVTVPSVAFWWLKRFLPIRVMDWVLRQASGGGKR